MREEKLVIKMSKEEKERLNKFAKEQCINLSALVRKLLNEYVRSVRQCD